MSTDRALALLDRFLWIAPLLVAAMILWIGLDQVANYPVLVLALLGCSIGSAGYYKARGLL